MNRRREEGNSLIEVLISIAIMGITVVAILAALATQLKGTRVHRDQSNGQAVLTSASEKVQSAAFVDCNSGAPSTAYTAAARTATLPNDWVSQGYTTTSALTTTVSNWDGTAFVSTCPDNTTDTLGLLKLQLVTVTVTAPGASDTESLAIVKRG
jgi:Tfp pilus assembly protein PilV